MWVVSLLVAPLRSSNRVAGLLAVVRSSEFKARCLQIVRFEAPFSDIFGLLFGGRFPGQN